MPNLDIRIKQTSMSNGDLNAPALEKMLSAQQDAFTEVVRKLAEQHDVLAEYLPGSLAIETVDSSENRVHFRYCWFANYGCSDVRKEGTEQDSWRFRTEDDHIIITTYLPEEPPSTCDEF